MPTILGNTRAVSEALHTGGVLCRSTASRCQSEALPVLRQEKRHEHGQFAEDHP